MLRVQLSLRAPTGAVIMVTSAGAGDGKTTVAAALAAAFSEVEEDVILIDLDLRKRDLGRLLGVQDAGSENGGGGSPQSLATPGLDHVRVIAAPKGDPALHEAFIRRLPDVLEQARRSASYVILDTAPVGEVSETLRISQMCDQVVVVVRPRHTERRRIGLARDLLERADAPTIGIVVVGEDSGLGSGYYGYGYSPALNGERKDNDRSPLPSAIHRRSR